MPLRALHFYANHKVTGPAELALEAARALLAQDVAASFYSSDVPEEPPARGRWLQHLARARGVPEPSGLQGVRLDKHLRLSAILDVRRLAVWLRAHPPDLVHCHQPNDHLLCSWALRRAGLEVAVVRSLYDAEPPRPRRRVRRTLAQARAVVCHGEGTARALTARAGEYGLDPARVRYLPPPIDVRRFDRARAGVAPRRDALGVPADAFCLGIVARMQTHRRFEVLLQAIAQAVRELPALHVVIVGRGTNQETVARGPVRDLGLEGRVHFAGYVKGDEYVDTLASLDAKVFLVPGSDGTCRAVREALSMGLPVIATRRGMLPELVREGETGLLVDETPDALAAAFAALARDPELVRRMSSAARADAVQRFDFERYGKAVAALYAEVAAAPSGGGG